jgi:hypothetical protein
LPTAGQQIIFAAGLAVLDEQNFSCAGKNSRDAMANRRFFVARGAYWVMVFG